MCLLLWLGSEDVLENLCKNVSFSPSLFLLCYADQAATHSIARVGNWDWTSSDSQCFSKPKSENVPVTILQMLCMWHTHMLVPPKFLFPKLTHWFIPTGIWINIWHMDYIWMCKNSFAQTWWCTKLTIFKQHLNLGVFFCIYLLVYVLSELPNIQCAFNGGHTSAQREKHHHSLPAPSARAVSVFWCMDGAGKPLHWSQGSLLVGNAPAYVIRRYFAHTTASKSSWCHGTGSHCLWWDWDSPSVTLRGRWLTEILYTIDWLITAGESQRQFLLMPN